MSDQELIREAKCGSGQATMELWNKWQRFIYLWCSRYYKRDSHYDMEDIMQTAFIGFSRAVKLYDEGKGSFMNYAMYHIRSVVRREILGYDHKVNPLDEAVSLYSPLPTDDDLLLIETIPSRTAVNVYEVIVWYDAKRIMQEAVKRLSVEHRELIKLRFYDELEYKDIAYITGLTPSRAREEVLKAQRKLWGMENMRNLKAELFPPMNYKAPTDLKAISNIQAERGFWKGVGKWA